MIRTRALAASALLAAVVALASCGGAADTVQQNRPQLQVPVGDSPQRGPSDAWVTVIEFGDFQCGFCRAEEPIVVNLEAAYAPDVRVVFKHYPLMSHADARPAAVAAECANAQGRFWEMHDLLFRTALDATTLASDAAQVPGLDV